MSTGRGRPRVGRPDELEKRVDALLLRALGRPVGQVAAMLQVSPRTVQLWTKDARGHEPLAKFAKAFPRCLGLAKEGYVDALAQ